MDGDIERGPAPGVLRGDHGDGELALLADHVSSFFELVLFILALSVSLFFGILTWVPYCARTLCAEVLAQHVDFVVAHAVGKFTYPVFARDVFLGTLFGLAASVFDQLQPFVEAGFGKAPMRPLGMNSPYSLEGLRGSIATVLYQASILFQARC